MNDALTVARLAGFLHIGAGVLLVAALIMFVGGLITWWTFLGLPHRDEGIIWMAHGVRTLFVLVAILTIVRFVQFNTQAVLQIIAIAVMLLLGWLVFEALRAGGGDDEKAH